MMLCDSIASTVGAIYGTSTVATYVESGAGIAVGGKTGLTALVTAVLFLLSIFLMPIFAFIPSAAASCALIYVGVLMMGSVKLIDFSDVRKSVPAFLTIAGMPFTYSITKGIGLGILSYIIISIICFVIEIIGHNCCPLASGEESKSPQWPVPIVKGILGVFYIIFFFVPTAV
jgi:AGZA family xanthine/uracil permease-like MFS transporter